MRMVLNCYLSLMRVKNKSVTFWYNRIHAGVRCTVERVFGVLKLHYGMAKARYLGLARNRTRFELMCVAHNIKRGVSIEQESYA